MDDTDNVVLSEVVAAMCHLVRRHPTLVNDTERLTVLVGYELGFGDEDEDEAPEDEAPKDEAPKDEDEAPKDGGVEVSLSKVADLLLFVKEALARGLKVVSVDDPKRRLIGYQVCKGDGTPLSYAYVSLTQVKETMHAKELAELGLDPTVVPSCLVSPGGREALLGMLKAMVS